MGSTTTVTTNTLAAIDLFREFSENERSEIAKHCLGRRFNTHQQILSQQDTSRDVYFIISGTVNVTYYSRSGKEIAFRNQGPGEMFGELSAIDGQLRSALVLAHTDTFLISMKADYFQELLCCYPKAAYKVMQHLTQLVRLLSERVVEFSALHVNNRVHAELLRLARKSKVENGKATIFPVPTHTEIANRVGTRREAVSRELNALERTGLIEREQDSWIVNDVDRLQNMVQELL